jgi:hypothetical protein
MPVFRVERIELKIYAMKRNGAVMNFQIKWRNLRIVYMLLSVVSLLESKSGFVAGDKCNSGCSGMELLSCGGVTQEERSFSTLFKSWLIALPTLLRSVRSFDKSSKAASRVNRLYKECNSREVFWIVCHSEEVTI